MTSTTPPELDPTPTAGWARIESQLERARESLAEARHTEQFQAIGLQCREILISLAQEVYRRDRHPSLDGVEPSKSDSKRMLHAYLAVELRGDANREERQHAESAVDLAHSALDLANRVQHSRSADFRRAAMCLEATTSVVKFIAIAAGRGDSQHTVADLCRRYIEGLNPRSSHRYVLQRLSKMPIGRVIASKLQTKDVVDHCMKRRETVQAATVTHDIVFLRGVLLTARNKWNLDVSPDPVDRAKPILERAKVYGHSKPRTRRPTREELAQLSAYLMEQDKRSEIPMAELMEFALWSARRIKEICSLRWEDVNVSKRTCVVRDVISPRSKQLRDHEFPLLGKAWDIVQRQPRKDERIFPYNPKSAGQRYTLAKKVLGITNLRFHDLRREAAIRLFSAGYSVEQVAQVTGHMDLTTLWREYRDTDDVRAVA